MRTSDPGGPLFTVNDKGEIVRVPTVTLPSGREAPIRDGTPGEWGNSAPPNSLPQTTITLPNGAVVPIRDGTPQEWGHVPGATPPSPTQDYSGFLGIYGLPTDVQNKVNQIFTQTTDVSQATALAMAYVRGTPWYAQTYPGIQEGIARGVVSNEADYRSYLNNVNQLTKQYLGRDIGGSEIADFLKQGFGVDRISRIYQGGAIAKTYGGDWNYLAGAFDTGPLSAEEASAAGQEQAGIDTALGQKVQRRLDLAKQRMQAAFSGTNASSSLSLANGRLAAPGLAAGAAPNDVAA